MSTCGVLCSVAGYRQHRRGDLGEPAKCGEALWLFLQAENALFQEKKDSRNQIIMFRDITPLKLAKG